MTAMNRIGSVSLLNDTMRDVSSVQEQLATLQQQISSGVKANTFEQPNGQVEQFTLLENKISRGTQFSQNNEVVSARLNTADQALQQLGSVADDMNKLILTQRNGPTGDTLQFKQQMMACLEAFSNALNVSFDGRYVFSGTATLTPPVSSTTTPPLVQGTPDASYYQGSTISQTVRVDENTTFDFPVRADDPAFQKLYAAAHMAMQAYDSGDDTKMGQALDMLQDGQEDLNTARAAVNSQIVNVGNINDRLDTMNLYWKGVTDKVGKTDLVAASTQVASYEAVLQATYQVYARLSQLRLSDYLK
jgi:flagellar hook-associated protein 3 FlgL